MWNSFFLLFFIYFLSLLLTFLVLGLGNLVPLQYAIFFFYCEGRCNGVPLFVMAVEFDHSGSYLGIAGSDIRCCLLWLFKNLVVFNGFLRIVRLKLDNSSAFLLNKMFWVVHKVFLIMLINLFLRCKNILWSLFRRAIMILFSAISCKLLYLYRLILFLVLAQSLPSWQC
jgi:hypothetical protein